MSAIHELKCDWCNKRTALKYNGEHWLPPTGWAQLWDDNKAQTEDEHMCPECRPKLIKKPKPKARP